MWRLQLGQTAMVVVVAAARRVLHLLELLLLALSHRGALHHLSVAVAVAVAVAVVMAVAAVAVAAAAAVAVAAVVALVAWWRRLW